MSQQNINTSIPTSTDSEQLSKKERWSYWLCSFGQMSIFTLVMGYVQVFMTDLAIPAAAVGTIILAARIWDAVNDPLFGVAVSKANMKGGKYKPWLKISSVALLFISIGLFAIPSDMPIGMKTFLAAALYILWGMAYTVCDVPYFSIMTSMTSNVGERNYVISIARMFTMIGMAVVGISTPLLYPRIGWLPTAAIVSAIAFAVMFSFSVSATERHMPAGEPPTITRIFKAIKGNRYLLIFVISFVVANITNTVTTVGSYFAIHCLGGPDMIAVTAAVPMLATVVFFAIVPAIINKIDKFAIYMSSIIGTIILSIAICFAGYENLPAYLVLSGMRGVCSNFVSTYVALFIMECAEYGRFKTGEDATPVAVSLQTFGAKTIGAIAGSLGMFMLGLAGFAQGEGAAQPPAVIDTLWFMMSIMPVIGMAIAFVILLFGYKLRDKDVQIMAKANQGEITKEEAERLLSRAY
ncbi:MAG: MFS transporter [Clostridiales bacterium]|jgi:Na+/melibiose symporter-like transporter|nr:MFS transporter [Clostridiales bacterium]